MPNGSQESQQHPRVSTRAAASSCKVITSLPAFTCLSESPSSWSHRMKLESQLLNLIVVLSLAVEEKALQVGQVQQLQRK